MVINDKEKESFVNEPKDDKPTDSGSGHKTQRWEEEEDKAHQGDRLLRRQRRVLLLPKRTTTTTTTREDGQFELFF